MAGKFMVALVTPKGVVFDKEVEEVIAPGILGEFGVLIGHTPMLTFIKPGVLSYLENDRFTRFAVGPGFCEVLPDKVSVLVEEAYSADQIDAKDASSQVSKYEQELAGVDSTADPDAYQKALDKLKLARAKMSVAALS